MEKFIMENYNPEGKRIGDCVLRGITAFHSFDQNYEENDSDKIYYNTKKEIEKYGQYNIQWNFEKYLRDNNFVRLNAYSWVKNIKIRTVNQLAIFCSNFKVQALGVSNNHMTYVDPELGIIDTWDSRLKRLESIYFKKEDVERLKIIIDEETKSNTEIPFIDTKKNTIHFNKINGVTSKKMNIK